MTAMDKKTKTRKMTEGESIDNDSPFFYPYDSFQPVPTALQCN